MTYHYNSNLKNHRAQWLNNALLVVGGGGPRWAESCTINQETDKLECVDITPNLDAYRYGVSFLVLSDECLV